MVVDRRSTPTPETWGWMLGLILVVFVSCGGSSVSSNQLGRTDWSRFTYPMTQCESPGSSFNPGVPVEPAVYATPARGVLLAVVVVHCKIASHPPNAVFVYLQDSSSTTPRLIQTLVNEHDYWLATAPPRASGSQLSLPVEGYAPSDSGANPSIRATLTWQWSGTGYQETSPEPSHQFSGS